MAPTLWKTQPDNKLKNKGLGENHSQFQFFIFIPFIKQTLPLTLTNPFIRQNQWQITLTNPLDTTIVLIQPQRIMQILKIYDATKHIKLTLTIILTVAFVFQFITYIFC